jgi:hypothetical protein
MNVSGWSDLNASGVSLTNLISLGKKWYLVGGYSLRYYHNSREESVSTISQVFTLGLALELGSQQKKS